MDLTSLFGNTWLLVGVAVVVLCLAGLAVYMYTSSARNTVVSMEQGAPYDTLPQSDAEDEDESAPAPPAESTPLEAAQQPEPAEQS